jgi:dTMP kinase
MTGNEYDGSESRGDSYTTRNGGNGYEGVLIAIEGIDGAGKSTALEAITSWAESADVDIVSTKEPTDFWTGEQVYRSLKDDDATALTDFSLFVADRAKHVEKRVKPALKEGKIVVTDRYSGSTRAYQTHRLADEMGISYDEARAWMDDMFEPWNVEPDITLYIDISVDTAMERCGHEDKYEKRDNLEQVKAAYDQMYGLCDSDTRIIDGEQSKSHVRHMAVNAIRAQVHTSTDQSLDGDDKSYVDAIEEDQ